MELRLPTKLISRGDLTRIMRELNSLNDHMVGSELRQDNGSSALQHVSPVLKELSELNQVDLLKDEHRHSLYAVLEKLEKGAPSLHISFTAEPSPKALEKILDWMRTNIHHQLLLQVGLMPNIAAGCIVRTPNRVIDLSLKETFIKNQPYLLKLIQAATHE